MSSNYNIFLQHILHLKYIGPDVSELEYKITLDVYKECEKIALVLIVTWVGGRTRRSAPTTKNLPPKTREVVI